MFLRFVLKKALIILLFLLGCNVYAQHVYFNNRYDFDKFEYGLSVIAKSNYFILSESTTAQSSLPRIRICAIDTGGAVLWNKGIQSSTVGYNAGAQGSLTNTTDGGSTSRLVKIE